jgi:hypothetical protein
MLTEVSRRVVGGASIVTIVLVLAFALACGGCGGGGGQTATDTEESDIIEDSWECVGIIAGDAPAQTPGWYHGDWTIDADGNMSTTTPVSDSLGNNTWVPAGGSTISISASGIVTLDNDPGLQFRGVMNSAKNVIAVSATMAPGDADDVSGYNLALWIKP